MFQVLVLEVERKIQKSNFVFITKTIVTSSGHKFNVFSPSLKMLLYSKGVFLK